MKLIFCVDDNNGMMFNNRRQSQDSALRERAAALSSQSVLWMSEYSAKQFGEAENYRADNDYMSKAADEDFCFVEDLDYSLDNCSEVVLYKWNRHYPADRYFESDLKSLGFSLFSKKEFAGSSHKKITEEIYKKQERK